jgi:hypothetical protein
MEGSVKSTATPVSFDCTGKISQIAQLMSLLLYSHVE